MTAGKIVQHSHLVVVLQKKTDGRAADVTRASGNQYVFGHLLHRAKRVVPNGRCNGPRIECSSAQSEHNARLTASGGIFGLAGRRRNSFSSETLRQLYRERPLEPIG